MVVVTGNKKIGGCYRITDANVTREFRHIFQGNYSVINSIRWGKCYLAQDNVTKNTLILLNAINQKGFDKENNLVQLYKFYNPK
jgi:hypothetical protein